MNYYCYYCYIDFQKKETFVKKNKTNTKTMQMEEKKFNFIFIHQLDMTTITQSIFRRTSFIYSER